MRCGFHTEAVRLLVLGDDHADADTRVISFLRHVLPIPSFPPGSRERQVAGSSTPLSTSVAILELRHGIGKWWCHSYEFLCLCKTFENTERSDLHRRQHHHHHRRRFEADSRENRYYSNDTDSRQIRGSAPLGEK